MSQIPPFMQAAVLRGPGEPLSIESIPVPRPRTGEVLVKVAACGLCHSDLHVMHGAIAFPTPAVLGHEVSGTVVEIGAGVARPDLVVGQQVCGAFLMPCGSCPECARGRDDLCGPFFALNRLKGQLFDQTSRLSDAEGAVIAQYSMAGLAEYCVIPQTAVTPLPEGMDPVASAILGCAAMTAYGALRRGADLRHGESVAVIGVGGVGSAILQIAAAFGAGPVIAIDIDDTKLAAAHRLGATHQINSRTRDAAAEVGRVTGGRGVDVAFEALGLPATFEQALDLLADGGRMVPVGLAAGSQAARVPINRLVRRGQSIQGSYGARTRADLPAVVELARAGVIDYRSVVSRRIPLSEVNDGYSLLESGGITGRAVVDFTG